MIPFKELQDLADKCRKKLNKNYFSIEVEYHAWKEGSSELEYIIYSPETGFASYKTAQECQAAMQRILDPPQQDKGVSVGG